MNSNTFSGRFVLWFCLIAMLEVLTLGRVSKTYNAKLMFCVATKIWTWPKLGYKAIFLHKKLLAKRNAWL